MHAKLTLLSNATINASITDVTPAMDVINVYNVYKKNICKRVYYFVNVYLNKNYMSETKQNYDSDEDN